MSIYSTQYKELLAKASVDEKSLPTWLQEITSKFENALNALNKAEPDTQNTLIDIITKADAVIAAHIWNLYKEQLANESVNKVKLMALKAKALKLKWQQKK